MTKAQRTKLNKLLRQAMIRRDGEHCLRCGKTPVQTSHIKSRGKYRKLAFDINNVKPLCVACHLYWWHKEPLEAAEWIREQFPDRVEYLEKKIRTIDKTIMVYETIKEQLKGRKENGKKKSIVPVATRET